MDGFFINGTLGDGRVGASVDYHFRYENALQNHSIVSEEIGT